MAWFLLIIAGLFETGWAIGLKYTDGFTRFWPSVNWGMVSLSWKSKNKEPRLGYHRYAAEFVLICGGGNVARAPACYEPRPSGSAFEAASSAP
jgi:hypothetical protein